MSAKDMKKRKKKQNFPKPPDDGSTLQLLGSRVYLWLSVSPLEPQTWHHSYSQYLQTRIFLLRYLSEYLNYLLQKGHSMNLSTSDSCSISISSTYNTRFESSCTSGDLCDSRNFEWSQIPECRDPLHSTQKLLLQWEHAILDRSWLNFKEIEC